MSDLLTNLITTIFCCLWLLGCDGTHKQVPVVQNTCGKFEGDLSKVDPGRCPYWFSSEVTNVSLHSPAGSYPVRRGDKIEWECPQSQIVKNDRCVSPYSSRCAAAIITIPIPEDGSEHVVLCRLFQERMFIALDDQPEIEMPETSK